MALFIIFVMSIGGLTLRNRSIPRSGQRVLRNGVAILVQRAEARQRNMDRAIDRCAGAREDTHDTERMVAVKRKADIAGPVSDDNFFADRVAQRLCNVGAQYGIALFLEAMARREYQIAVPCKPEMIEIILVRAEHTKSTMRVAERQRYRPRDFRPRRNRAIAVPPNVVSRVADSKHGKQQ